MQDCVQSARFDQKCLAGAVGAPCWLSPSPAPPPGHGPPCAAWLPHFPPLLMQHPQLEEEAEGPSAGWEAYCWVPVCGTSCSTPGSLCRHCCPRPTATKSPVWPATGTSAGSTHFLVAVQWMGTSVALLWLPEHQPAVVRWQLAVSPSYGKKVAAVATTLRSVSVWRVENCPFMYRGYLEVLRDYWAGERGFFQLRILLCLFITSVTCGHVCPGMY